MKSGGFTPAPIARGIPRTTPSNLHRTRTNPVVSGGRFAFCLRIDSGIFWNGLLRQRGFPNFYRAVLEAHTGLSRWKAFHRNVGYDIPCWRLRGRTLAHVPCIILEHRQCRLEVNTRSGQVFVIGIVQDWDLLKADRVSEAFVAGVVVRDGASVQRGSRVETAVSDVSHELLVLFSTFMVTSHRTEEKKLNWKHWILIIHLIRLIYIPIAS